MDSQTILRPNDVDLKRLPLGAREAFVLSQIDGRLTLEEVAEIAGLGVEEATRLAQVLLELGAASKVRVDPRAESGSSHGSMRPRAEKPLGREEPRAVKKSVRRPDPRADPRAEQVSMRPSGPRRSTPPPVQRPARKPVPVPAASDVCELDAETQATLAALDARLKGARDHYAVLEIDRAADKKTVKRAYFAFASKYHPDRFFGKELGKAGPQIDRIFRRFTEAHDTLTSTTDRAAYDKSLPAAPATPARPSRKMSKARMARVSSRQIAAAKKATTKLDAVTAEVEAEAAAPAHEEPRIELEEKRRNLRDAATEIKTQERIDLFLKAAEEALEKNDVITAANNYRLALEHREDLRVRMIFEDVDARAKKQRFEKQMGPAKAAERDHRWNDAAHFLTKAHAIIPCADVAIRAAHALRMIGSDLDRAIELAEEAVGLEPRVVAHHVAFAEILIAAKRYDRAEDQLETAKDLAPKDDTVKALAAILSKRKKT